MKKYLKSFIFSYLGLLLVSYLSIAFDTLRMNPFLWDKGSREGFITLFWVDILLALIVAGIIKEAKK